MTGFTSDFCEDGSNVFKQDIYFEISNIEYLVEKYLNVRLFMWSNIKHKKSGLPPYRSHFLILKSEDDSTIEKINTLPIIEFIYNKLDSHTDFKNLKKVD